MASFLAAGMQTATWFSAGMGEAVFSSRLARTRAAVGGFSVGWVGPRSEMPLTCTGPHTRTHSMPINHTVPPLAYNTCTARAHTQHVNSTCTSARSAHARTYIQAPTRMYAIAGLTRACEGSSSRSENALPKDAVLQPVPGHVLGAAAKACEPRTRAASAPDRQPPVRRRGRGASPGAGRGHRPPNPAAQAQEPSWTPRTTDHTQPNPAPHWTQGANGG
jgi:hypothetical protein